MQNAIVSSSRHLEMCHRMRRLCKVKDLVATPRPLVNTSGSCSRGPFTRSDRHCDLFVHRGETKTLSCIPGLPRRRNAMRCRRTISFLPMRLLTCALTSPADACLSPRVNACAGRRRGSAQAAKRARKGGSHARRRGRRPRRPAAAAVRRQTVRAAHAMCTLNGASGSARSPAACRAACAAGGHPQKSHNNSPQVL